MDADPNGSAPPGEPGRRRDVGRLGGHGWVVTDGGRLPVDGCLRRQPSLSAVGTGRRSRTTDAFALRAAERINASHA